MKIDTTDSSLHLTIDKTDAQLRDEFAGQIIAGMTTAKFTEGAFTKMARAAYSLADAMLAERAKR